MLPTLHGFTLGTAPRSDKESHGVFFRQGPLEIQEMDGDYVGRRDPGGSHM